ncbi:MAG: acyltransferase, partial [Bacteroidetes bacterium]|nr:acyltransferase [Bacteroidota bacterium]
IIGLSYFVFPYVDLLAYPGANANVFADYGKRLFFLSLVLPNYAFVLYDLPYWCAQAWSIGVEEQFYYLWPWLIRYPKRSLPIFLLFLALTSGLLYLGLQTKDANPVQQIQIIGTFIGQFRIQIMAVGGFFAYLVFSENSKVLDVLFRREIQIGVYLFTVALFLSGIHFPAFMEAYSLLFGYFILNLSSNPRSIINFEGKFLNYSGKVSYGLYLYHVVALVLVLNILRIYTPALTGAYYNIILYVSVVVLSVLISAGLYEFLEKPLLRYKDERFGR